VALLVRFVRSGGIPMLRMMNGPADAEHDHDHGGHEHGMEHHPSH
jgi:hypothetical protein